MAAIKSKASAVPEDNCEDAPPPYHSNTTGVPYAKPGSTTQGNHLTPVRSLVLILSSCRLIVCEYKAISKLN